MRRRVVAFMLATLASGAVVSVACSSFEEGSEGAADANIEGAANADDGDAPRADGAADAQPSDAAVLDADPCTQPDAFFCDDFERPAANLLGTEWSLLNPGYGPATLGIFTLDAGDPPPSGTRVLRARHRQPDAGVVNANSSRYLYFTYQGTPAALDVSFAMKVLVVPKPSTQIMEIAFAPTADAGETGIVISLEDEGNQLHLFEELTSGSSNNAHVDDLVVVDVWRHYRLRVDTAKKKAYLSIEGRAQDLELTLERNHGAPREVRFGVVYEPTQTANTDTWIDDVIIQR